MPRDEVVLLGIHIPSTDPVFLAILAVHVASGLVAVLSGAVAMLVRKGAGRHPRAGTIYYAALVSTWLTALLLTAFRPVENWPLALLGSAAFVAATIGRTAHRRSWTYRINAHVVSMGASYILMLTAFYVDNGPHLPGWRELPTWVHWTVSAIVGVPLIVRALLGHPLVVAERRPPGGS